MRSVFRGTTALVLLMLVVSCGLLKKKGDDDGGAEASVAEVAADAAPAPVAAALATNEGDVARFPDETKLADTPAVLQRTYNLREAPPAGTVVIGLPKGTAVTQIAQRDRYILLLVDNKASPGTKLMGWVHRDAFSAVVQDAGPLVCPAGEVALAGDTPFCGKLCSADGDCPPTAAGAPQACKGSANKLLPNGKAGDGVTVCTVFHPHDAGAPPPPPPPPAPDAGKLVPPVSIDAGKPSVIIDAGPPPPPPTGADVVEAVGGKCSGGFVFVDKTKKCHRPCPGGPTKGECSSKSVCIKCNKPEVKVCALSQGDCR